MAEYLVTWMIDIEADSAEDAAYKALKIQRDRASIAVVFHVRDVDSGDAVTVDLNAADD